MTGKKYISYTITDVSAEQQEIWIALLDDYGFTGYEQQDNAFTATALVEEIDQLSVESFLQENDLGFSTAVIEEKNWNEQWERSFEPIVVTDFCAVRAAFHQPVTGVQHDIIITPKMSFGTGHHATTYMMLQAMQQLDFAGKEVLDFGTGTGILAILAEKMGAATVEAIDYDDWCIENGTENIAANNCRHILLQKADDLQQARPADILLANINKHVILANLAAMQAKLKPGGQLLVSGLLVADEEEIRIAAQYYFFEVVQLFQRNGWICILFRPQAEIV